MPETKRFHVRDLLTVTTGRFLCRPISSSDNGIRALYMLLGWMTNDSPMTHQLGRFAGECKPWLLRWFPELANADRQLGILGETIKLLGPENGVEAWLGWREACVQEETNDA